MVTEGAGPGVRNPASTLCCGGVPAGVISH